MARRSALRASDEDRERIAERLRSAMGEGRLLAEELEERLGVALSARTYGELDALVSDLPALRDDRRRRTPLWVKATLALAIVLAAIAVLALVAFIVVGVAGAWLLWMVLAWMFFGRRARLGPWGHSRAHARGVRHGRAGAGVPRGRTAPFL